MKTLHIVAILLAAMLIPLAAAEDAETTDAYIVTPASDDSKPHIAPRTQGTITQGETDWHSKIVGTNINTLNVDSNWGDTTDSIWITTSNPQQPRIQWDNGLLSELSETVSGSKGQPIPLPRSKR